MIRILSVTQLLVLLSVVSTEVFSQVDKIVPPTPNALKMTEYYAQRPNMYTGTASVTIPLHTINFDGWEIPLSISYNATGVRTNEEAGEVGLGWALNATALISRTIRGSDDLVTGSLVTGFVHDSKPVTHELGYEYNNPNVPLVPRTIPTNSYYYHLVYAKPDTQPDIFNYNFFGYSGSFILSQKVANNGTVEVLKITQDASIISFNESARTFSVITPEGFRGEFSVKELSTSFFYTTTPIAVLNNTCWGEDNVDIQQSKNEGRFRTISSWYLDRIISPRGEILTFTYDLNPDGSSPYISNARANGESSSDVAQLPGLSQTIHEHVYLKSIRSLDIDIAFSMENREDIRVNRLFDPTSSNPNFLAGSALKRYTQIRITSASQQSVANGLDKKILFRQSYFNNQFLDELSGNQNENELRWLRSRLDGVMINDQEYRFFYEKGLASIPDKLTYSIDHFGFFNGKETNMQLLPPDLVSGSITSCEIAPPNFNTVTYYRQKSVRLVDFAFGKAGLLTKVRYPTGGYSVFEYEPHQYQVEAVGNFREQAPNGPAGGARIKSIKEFDFGDKRLLSKTYHYVDNPNQPPGSQTTSGRLMVPLFNRYIEFRRNVLQDPMPISTCFFRYTTNSSIPGNNSAEGKVIGYSVVHETVEGNDSYRNTYKFENRPSEVLAGNSVAIGYPNLNGQTISVKNYSSSGQIVRLTENQDLYHPISLVKGIAYGQSDDPWGFGYVAKYNLESTFNTPYVVKITTAGPAGGITENSSGEITSYGNSHQSTTRFTFDTTGENATYLLKSQETSNSLNETIKTEYRRPSDYGSPSAALSHMKSKAVNMVKPVIEEITRSNSKLVSASGNRYELEHGRVNLKASYSFNTLNSFSPSPNGLLFENGYELNQEFVLYDAGTGKLKQFVDRTGIVNSIIWGYGNRFPIVQGVGISYDQLQAAFVAAQAFGEVGTVAYETALRNHSFTAGKQITTYQHNPLVGVTKITDPNGQTKSFQYDNNARLKRVLDHSGFTLQEHAYHFSKRQATRILALSGPKLSAGVLSFGTLTPDMFATQINPYPRCTDKLRSNTLSISNLGEDDLTVKLNLPIGFSTVWRGATNPTIIPAGTSVDVIIEFNGATVPPGLYTGILSIESDKTAGDSEVTLSANYVNRVSSISLSPVTGASPAILYLGTTSGLIAGRSIQITNNGNAAFRIVGLPLDWDGTSTNYSSFVNPDFCVSYNFGRFYADGSTDNVCIGVGESVTLPVTFNPTSGGPNGVRSTKLSIITDIPSGFWPPNLYKDAVRMEVNLQRPVSIISVSTSNINFGDFTDATQSREVTVSNTGTLGFNVNGMTISDSNLSGWFSLSPTSWTIDPGSSKTFVLTFQPIIKDQLVNTTMSLNSNAMTGLNLVNITGRRYSLRQILLSTEPSNVLVYDQPNDSKAITISNSIASNDPLSITGIGPANLNPNDWAIVGFTPKSLVPGESMTFEVRRTGANPPNETITITSSKNAGVNSLIMVRAATRIINVETLPSTTLPPFSGPTVSQDLTVSNSGESTLQVWSVSSSNPRFTVSPAVFTVAPYSQKTVTLTYTPNNFEFTQHSATISFSANHTAGNNVITVTGERMRILSLQLSTTGLVFDATGETKYVTITNPSSSNDHLHISGVSYPATPNWSASLTPTSLLPGESTTLSITRTTGANEPLNFVVNSNAGSPSVHASANTREIAILPGSLTLPYFDSPSVSQSISVRNNGNTTLSVNSVSSSNAHFSVAPNSFSVGPGSQVDVTVTYTPAAFDFSQQTSGIVFHGNQTSGTPSMTVVGQRTAFRTIQLSNHSLSFMYTGQTQWINITNIGNDYLNITGVSYPSTAHWSATVTPTTLVPGQSTSLSITRLPGPNPEVLSVSVLSNKNGGNEVVQVNAITRNIQLTGISFPAFTSESTSQPMTITNSGNSDLNISNITSSNSLFSVSPTSLVVGPNGQQQIVMVTYTPNNFSSQSTTLNVTSNATFGTSSLTTTAQRAFLTQLSPSTTFLSVKPWNQTPFSELTNTGNTAVIINGPGVNSNPSRFSVSYRVIQFASFVPATFPVTLQPGEQLRVVASTAQAGDFSSATGSLSISTSAGTISITLSRSTF